MADRVRVLIVDPSPLVRQELQRLLARDAAIEVVGVAADAAIAERKIRVLRPDVLVVDLAAGLLEAMSRAKPLLWVQPTVVAMVRGSSHDDAPVRERVREIGAVAVVARPTSCETAEFEGFAVELGQKIKAAANLVERVRPREPHVVTGLRPIPTSATQVIAVGASTGGPPALQTIVLGLSSDTPCLLVVQHMPGRFTAKFAEGLNRICGMLVTEAEDGDRVAPGRVLIAPGGHHMALDADGSGGYRVRVFDAPPVNHHRPSVDVLFNSVAAHAGPAAIGVILTGMGADGAAGLLAIRRAGGMTMAQDEATSAVFGMPKEAIALGAVDRIVPLEGIASEIVASYSVRRVGGRVLPTGSLEELRWQQS